MKINKFLLALLVSTSMIVFAQDSTSSVNWQEAKDKTIAALEKAKESLSSAWQKTAETAQDIKAKALDALTPAQKNDLDILKAKIEEQKKSVESSTGDLKAQAQAKLEQLQEQIEAFKQKHGLTDSAAVWEKAKEVASTAKDYLMQGAQTVADTLGIKGSVETSPAE